MYRYKFLVVIVINLAVFRTIQAAAALARNNYMMAPSLYAGAHLNRAISTGAGFRSAIDDIRGLPLFGGLGPSVYVTKKPSPDMVRQMLMVQIAGAMAMLTGMSNGGMIVEDGKQIPRGMALEDGRLMAMPRGNSRMIVDDAPIRDEETAMEGLPGNNGVPITGGRPTEPESGGTPWTGGMPMGAGNMEVPITGGRPTVPVSGGTPWSGGMPMVAGNMGVPKTVGRPTDPKSGVTPWAGGMPMGFGSNGRFMTGGMPFYRNMAMMNAMVMQKGTGGMPMGQSTNGNQSTAEGGEAMVTANGASATEEPPVATSNGKVGGKTSAGETRHTAAPKDV